MSFTILRDFATGTAYVDNLVQPILGNALPSLAKQDTDYPYLLSKELSDLLLTKYGLPLTGLGRLAHPHPAHKTIENHFYYTQLPALTRKLPTTALFMKAQKVHRLSNRGINFTASIGQVLTGRDFARYDKSEAFKISTPVAYMDFAIMFYSPNEILDLFTQSPNLNSLIATLIVPPESDDFDQSLNPLLYRYSKSHGSLTYYLEGHANGAYTQPLVASHWLRLNSIKSTHLHLTVSLESTTGSFHVFSINRGSVPFP